MAATSPAGGNEVGVAAARICVFAAAEGVKASGRRRRWSGSIWTQMGSDGPALICNLLLFDDYDDGKRDPGSAPQHEDVRDSGPGLGGGGLLFRQRWSACWFGTDLPKLVPVVSWGDVDAGENREGDSGVYTPLPC